MPEVTLVRSNVRRVPGTLLFSVTTLPREPVTLHVSMVPWFSSKVMVCATVFVDANSVNELAADSVRVEVPVAPPIVSLLKANPPKKVLALVVVLDKTILAVFLLNVKFDLVMVFHTFPVPVSVHSPDPIVMVRAPVPVPLNVVQVRLKLFASSTPRKSVTEELELKFPSSWNVPPKEITETGKVIVLPALVKVMVPRPAKV